MASFETNDFYYKTGQIAALFGIGAKDVEFSIPRNLYKRLLIEVEFLNIRLSSMFDACPGKDTEKEDHSGRIQEAKQLYEKNYRLHSSKWSDYEKKKVTAAYSMLQLVEINHKIYLNGNLDLTSIDFRVMRDLFKNCIGDETYGLTTSMLLISLAVYKQTNHYKLARFCIVTMEENIKIAHAKELVQKYKHLKANSLMSYEEDLLYKKFIILEMKLVLVKLIFIDSIDFLGCGDELGLNAFDEGNGGILMEVFKGKELSDPEFDAVPSKIRNYEEAEKTARFISKMSQKRVELAEKNSEIVEEINKWMCLTEGQNCRTVYMPILLKMKEFYSGFVYYATAYFHPDKNVKYKMMKKSIGYLETLMKSGDVHEFPQMTPEFSETCMILSDAYAVAWRIKYEMYQEKPSEDAWNLIKKLAAERVRLGNASQHSNLCEHRRISTMYDLVKCYTLVLKDNATAKAKTGELIDFLIENPKVLGCFQKLSGVRVSKHIKKPLLISSVINSCK